jgi:hypothetical protein
VDAKARAIAPGAKGARGRSDVGLARPLLFVEAPMNHPATGLYALLLLSSTSLFGATIAQWTFETSLPVTAGPLTPEVGSGTATSGTGGTFSNPAGWATSESWSSTAWDSGDYFQFQVSSAGYAGIAVSWQQTGSNTGPRDFLLQYSTDGVSFTTFSSYSLTNDGWNASSAPAASVKSFSLTAITALDGDASIFFRLTQSGTTSINGGTVAAGGTGRVDTFTVTGTAVPEPSTFAVLLGALALVVGASRRRRSE